MIAHIDTAIPLSKTAPAADRVLQMDDMSALFGIDMAAGPAALESKSRKPAATAKVVVPKTPSSRKVLAEPRKSTRVKAKSKPAAARKVVEDKQKPVKWWLKTKKRSTP